MDVTAQTALKLFELKPFHAGFEVESGLSVEKQTDEDFAVCAHGEVGLAIVKVNVEEFETSVLCHEFLGSVGCGAASGIDNGVVRHDDDRGMEHTVGVHIASIVDAGHAARCTDRLVQGLSGVYIKLGVHLNVQIGPHVAHIARRCGEGEHGAVVSHVVDDTDERHRVYATPNADGTAFLHFDVLAFDKSTAHGNDSGVGRDDLYVVGREKLVVTKHNADGVGVCRVATREGFAVVTT